MKYATNPTKMLPRKSTKKESGKDPPNSSGYRLPKHQPFRGNCWLRKTPIFHPQPPTPLVGIVASTFCWPGVERAALVCESWSRRKPPGTSKMQVDKQLMKAKTAVVDSTVNFGVPSHIKTVWFGKDFCGKL